jgi:hypothetical protein
MQIQANPEKYHFYKDDIVYIENFINDKLVDTLLSIFKEEDTQWAISSFFKCKMTDTPGLDPDNKFELAPDIFHKIEVEISALIVAHLQQRVKKIGGNVNKWETGSFAPVHVDGRDEDKVPNPFETIKISSILYLNDAEDGGNIIFPKEDISIKTTKGSLLIFESGHHNLHGVETLKSGERYTVLTLWDYEDADYSEERKQDWETEMSIIEEMKKIQQKEWERIEGLN